VPELILLGNMIDAQEAYRIGLISQVVSPQQLIKTSIQSTKDILKNVSVAIRMAIQSVNQGINGGLRTGFGIRGQPVWYLLHY